MPLLNQGNDWLAKLRSSGEEQEEAIEKLRNYLLNGLRKAYSGKGVDDAFCEDVVQDSLIKILQKLDQFAGRSKFTTWAMTIAVREAVSRFRRKHFRNVSLEDFTKGQKLEIEAPETAAGFSESNKSAILNKLRALIETELTEKQKIAVQAGLGGMPVEEIAGRMDSNRNAVYKLIHDARQKLKKGMEEAGFFWQNIQAEFS